MEMTLATKRLAALAHESRLSLYRCLMGVGPEGLAAGEIARRMQVAPNTLTAQLALLVQAGLVQSRRDGRSVIYGVDVAAMAELLHWLVQDCCAGRPELCLPSGITACCPAKETSNAL
jgi:ArsR family transcriptional regulator, arsenate/arsenite/antimonite-responsive transcriptional repressor